MKVVIESTLVEMCCLQMRNLQATLPLLLQLDKSKIEYETAIEKCKIERDAELKSQELERLTLIED